MMRISLLMRITKFIHSCVLIEKDKSRLLFDPGKFSFVEGLVKPEQFEGLTAIVLTHGHPDHVDASALKIILKRNPEAKLLANDQTLLELRTEGVIDNIQSSLCVEGERHVGGFHITAVPARHAPILGSEAPQNTAFLIDRTVLNPGDSFADTLDAHAGTPVLLLPVMAPWEKELEMFAFAQRMRPHAVIPVHDGQAKPFFIGQRYKTFDEQFTRHNITFANLTHPGDTFTWQAK